MVAPSSYSVAPLLRGELLMGLGGGAREFGADFRFGNRDALGGEIAPQFVDDVFIAWGLEIGGDDALSVGERRLADG
jgi:hypothetical protein